MSTPVWSLMAYGVVVATLLGLAAVVLERQLRERRGNGRWSWLAALAGSLVLPAASYIGLPAWLRPASALPEQIVLALPALVAAGEPVRSASLDVWLLAGWAAVSGVLGLYALCSWLRLRRVRRGWRSAQVDGVPVWLTPDIGPAAFGDVILLPEWALALDARLRGLLLLHETEHVRARDGRALLFGLAVVVLCPWNPALWWQLRRLRLAIELDCDRRVLGLTGDARLYGSLLLEVGRHRVGGRLVLAFSEPRHFLERRIRALGEHTAPGVRRAAAAVVAGASLLVLAVCAGDPLRPGGVHDAPAPVAPAVAVQDTTTPIAPTPAAVGEATADQPHFTPMTRAPELTNRAEIQQVLAENYPPLLRNAGIGGTPTVWFHIDETGRVTRTMLNASSGHAALDAAALRVADALRFTPARNGDRVVPVWVAIPIAFQPR